LSSPNGEQGLLGLAFHPDYARNGLFFVNYTAPTTGSNPCRTVIARYAVSPGNPDLALQSSEVRILEIEQPYSNHNGGMIAFGPDNCLYIGMGDGGDGNDPGEVGQNRTSLLGKILRIDIRDSTAQRRYIVPADNPYAGNTGIP
jgi:glucose/arabinose dehydrogenase